MTYQEAYRQAVRLLEEHQVPDAAIDARYLLEFVCDRNRAWFLAHSADVIGSEEYDRYMDLIRRRAERIPLQQLTGVQEFMGLEFKVSADVLIPRQDTETLVEEAMKVLRTGMRLLDVCTGSGCILISLMKLVSGLEGTGLDISERALEIAKYNAKALGADASFLQSDMFAALGEDERFDCIVSNPPYIAAAEIETLMDEVKDHEPRIALDGGADGLDFYRRIVSEAKKYLNSQGHLFMEIGYDQGEALVGLLEDNNWTQIEVIKDLCGNDRVVSAVKED